MVRAQVLLLLVPSAAVLVSIPDAVAAQRGQGGRGAGPAASPTPRQMASFDPTGYWVSQIVDEWRFRVSPQKGDILYLPLNNEARQIANAWDPEKDEADGKQCKAYGAIGVMQRPGRLHITWENSATLRVETDAGAQTRWLRFGPAPADKGPPSWQGYSVADWQVPVVRGRRGAPPLGQADLAPQQRPGTLRVVTTNLLPGYIRKNGVPHSEHAILTEYINRLTGQQGDVYLSLTAMVEDPTYLTQPFVRTYTFKKLPDASGWDPTPCWTR
jgi:hypothetical protein